MTVTNPSPTALSGTLVADTAEMANLDICVLGSGSSGNCTLLKLGDRNVIIDAGLSPRQTRLRMEQLDLDFFGIDGILLTHLDGDHLANGWHSQLRRRPIEVYLAREHAEAARAAKLPEACLRPVDSHFNLGPSTTVQTVRLAHDTTGCTAYIIDHHGTRFGHATDLGHVPDQLLDAFIDLDALAFESNYDRDMQLASDRPEFLKERIMGGSGHLSNEEALAAIEAIASRSRLQHIFALHLSRQCNCPDRLRSLWDRHAPALLDHLVITHQDRATPMIEVLADIRHATTR